MAAYRSRSIGGDPTRAARVVRFRPGLHRLIVGPLLVVAVLAAGHLARRGSLEVALHVRRGTLPMSASAPLRFSLDFDFSFLRPKAHVGVYEIRQTRLFGGSEGNGMVRDWSRRFVLDDCRLGFASTEGRISSVIAHERCAELPASSALRLEQARALEQLEAFRLDPSAASVDVVYGSRWRGIANALAALGLGAILLAAALFRRSVVTIDHARGEIRIDERRLFRARRRAALPLTEISGVCVETSRRWGSLYRVSVLSRAGRVPVNVGHAVGEKRHIALRLRLEAALGGSATP